MTLSPLGDSAVLLRLGDTIDAAMATRVRALAAAIKRQPPAGVTDVVPAFASVAVFYDVVPAFDFAALWAELSVIATRAESDVTPASSRRVEVPVAYGGDFGPDLAAVAEHAAVSPAEAVALHRDAGYVVYAIGFTPGFPYLGGLPPRLAMPRRATPRAVVPAGSVAIGGVQAGIYPIASPGGWNVIGRTPLRLFDWRRPDAALLQPGDEVRFVEMDRADFYDAAEAAEQALQECGAGAPAAPGSADGAERSSMTVRKAGMFTTVQDTGRAGHRSLGVPSGGAADPIALRLANLLVGNDENAAAVEFTLVGPELFFERETVIALGGAEFAGMPRGRPFRIPAGKSLNLGAATTGCRGYLAVAGGIDVAPVLGSRSTYVRGGFGGFEGRVLRDGDVLRVPVTAREFPDHWQIDPRILPRYSDRAVVRVIAGPHAPEFDSPLDVHDYTVTPYADRMGLRLAGQPLLRRDPGELLSSPVVPGVVQVPPDGQPIVLLADAQTIGGYPQIAHVITVDLPLLAQLRPGEAVRFREVTLAEAHELLAARERGVALLRGGLAQKVRQRF
jgi:KipI family sensor histidine kinase inhibitor